MKIKEFFPGYLEYRAKIGNCRKTLDEHARFLYGPIYNAIGEIELMDITLMARADLVEAGKPFGIFGPQRTVVYFRQLMQYVQAMGMKPRFDWRDLIIPKVPEKERIEYLTAEELEKVRNCFDIRETAGFRTRVLIEFMLATGLRIAECCSLNVEDIDWTEKEIRVINCKTKVLQTISIDNEHAIEWLKLYINSRTDNLPALFLSGRARLLPCTSRNYIRQQTKHLNLNKKIGHHVFRRTCGTYLFQNNSNVLEVQTHLRHKSPRTTMEYYIGFNKEKSRRVSAKTTEKFVSSPYSEPHFNC